MEISVVIPVYNSEKYLKRCLDSVLASLGKIDGEILVIDNNSTDDSADIIKKYAKQHPQVQALSCITAGAAAARNYGARHAQGKYLWFIDSDDTITKDAISKLLKTAKKEESDFVMLGIQRIYTDGHENYQG